MQYFNGNLLKQALPGTTVCNKNMKVVSRKVVDPLEVVVHKKPISCVAL
jgi:hypothetical protein